MELGTSIKSIRKKKGISQKELAKLCDISINTLCQIELNNTIPQKGTLNKIAEKLSVPPSYIIYFSLSEKDVPEDKRKLFNSLNAAMRDVLFEDI